MTQHCTLKNSAASPVVGVMLLLIITVIIAAIVSGYAGSLSETKDKSPQLVISPEIYRNDTILHMNIPVLSAGGGIQTRDLRIITEWVSFDKTGGNTASGGNEDHKYPTGRGAGVQDDVFGATEFGKYTLLGGTLMYIEDAEGCTALLGPDWNELKEGDLVTLRIIHIPSQTTIVDQNMIVRRI